MQILGTKNPRKDPKPKSPRIFFFQKILEVPEINLNQEHSPVRRRFPELLEVNHRMQRNQYNCYLLMMMLLCFWWWEAKDFHRKVKNKRKKCLIKKSNVS